jgi:hypothetical protein
MKLVLQKILANTAKKENRKTHCNLKPYQTAQMAKLQQEKQTKTSESNGRRRRRNEKQKHLNVVY